MLNFIKKHWKAILIAVVAIVLIIVVVNVIKHFSGANNSNTVTAGTPGIVTLDGNSVGVFDNQSDAEANKVTVDAGVKNLDVSGSGNIDVTATVGGFPIDVTNTKGSKYELNMDSLGDGSTVIVKVMVGGDGSLIGQRLGDDVETHYFAINVSNPNQETGDTAAQTAQALGLPNGKIYIEEDTYQTYGSETEAQTAVANQQNAFTLPLYMVKDGLSLTAEPTTDDTARIMVKVCMMDDESVESAGTYVGPDGNWSGTLDVSKYAGHQITLMIKAENGWAISNGYSYVSFFLPQFEVPEETIVPIVSGE